MTPDDLTKEDLATLREALGLAIRDRTLLDAGPDRVRETRNEIRRFKKLDARLAAAQERKGT